MPSAEGPHALIANLHSDFCILQFSVSDTGIGIPVDRQQLIFEPFKQGPSDRRREHEGTGLGLTIAARLVQRFGGALQVASEPGTGTTFAFTAAFAVAPAPVTPPELVLELTRLHSVPVLVVDDNATHRRLLVETLRGWAMRPTAVDNGLVALETLELARRAEEVALGG